MEGFILSHVSLHGLVHITMSKNGENVCVSFQACLELQSAKKERILRMHRSRVGVHL